MIFGYDEIIFPFMLSIATTFFQFISIRSISARQSYIYGYCSGNFTCMQNGMLFWANIRFSKITLVSFS